MFCFPLLSIILAPQLIVLVFRLNLLQMQIVVGRPILPSAVVKRVVCSGGLRTLHFQQFISTISQNGNQGCISHSVQQILRKAFSVKYTIL